MLYIYDKNGTIYNNGYALKKAFTFETKGFYFNDLNKNTVIDNLSIKSLAVLFMDDGNLNKRSLNMSLYSLSAYPDLVHKLKDTLNTKFNINSSFLTSKSSSSNNPYYYLGFNKTETEKLSELIAPYMHPSMDYKILEKHRVLCDLKNWDKVYENEFGCIVVTKEMEYIKTEKVYDMEVEDNHNFIVTSSTWVKNTKAKDFGIVAHNCQDVNTAQRLLMLKAIKENGRFVSVGDKFQAIYSFAGSDSDAFEKLINLPDVKLFPLSKSYRCGKNIIKSVQHIVPHIEANESNPDGVIIKADSVDNIEVGDMVLCRNTYPLVKLCLKFISEDKKANVMGADIGKTIITLLDQTRESDSEKAFARLYDKLNKTLERVIKKTGLSVDKAMKKAEYTNMLEKIKMIETIFSKLPEGNNSVNDISNKISSIFSDSTGNGILLSTIHKAKGLESKRVYIIHPELMPSKFAEKEWELEQENNLIYVARTRAISQLSYVTDYYAYDECNSEKVDTSNIVIRDSKHIGNLGERHKLIGEIIDVKFIQNYNTNVYIVEDANGNILEHWGAIPQHFSSSKTKRIGVGTKISGTIKIVKHTSFNNINKTSFKCLKR